jgi:hypothetical protein
MRDVPEDETWKTLKKGGTSGIYVVIVGLSWLIEAEKSEDVKHDMDTWTLVEDISWVIQQMKNEVAITLVPQKRGHDGEAENLSRKT